MWILGPKGLKLSAAARNKPVFVQAMNSTEDKLIICYCTILTTQGLKKNGTENMTTQKCIKNRSSLYHHHHCYFWHCHCRNHYSDHHRSFVFTCGITSINCIAVNNNNITVTISNTTTNTPTNSSLITTYYYCHHHRNYHYQQHNYSIILYHQHHHPHQRPLGWTMSIRLSTSRVIRPSSHALDSCNQLTNHSYLLRCIMCHKITKIVRAL